MLFLRLGTADTAFKPVPLDSFGFSQNFPDRRMLGSGSHMYSQFQCLVWSMRYSFVAVPCHAASLSLSLSHLCPSPGSLLEQVSISEPNSPGTGQTPAAWADNYRQTITSTRALPVMTRNNTRNNDGSFGFVGLSFLRVFMYRCQFRASV